MGEEDQVQEIRETLASMDKQLALISQRLENLEEDVEDQEDQSGAPPDHLVERDIAKLYTQVGIMQNDVSSVKKLQYFLLGSLFTVAGWLLKIHLTGSP